jgi:hypothetical protein
MDSLQAIVASSRNSPDELYRKAFVHFQGLFHSKTDVSKVQLPSHLPETVYNDRRVLGVVITAALMAMLDHRRKIGGAATADLIEILAGSLTMPAELQEQLDDIILQQAATTGAGLSASDLVLSRMLDWERHDFGKFNRLLRALNKAARIHQRMTPTPLTDPFRHDVKERALTELRPVMKRLQDEFKVRRREPSGIEIIAAFEREASKPELFFLNNPHNLGLWLDFLRAHPDNPLSLLSSGAAEVFDNFVAFATSHESDYTRRKVSSRA